MSPEHLLVGPLKVHGKTSQREVRSSRLLLLLSTIWLTALAGCASAPELPPEEAAGQRALAQAQALIDGDYERALQFVTPSYRDSPRARLYGGTHAGASFWTDAELAWVRCDEVPRPERCTVRLLIYNSNPLSARSRGLQPSPFVWEKVWIRLENEWYQYL